MFGRWDAGDELLTGLLSGIKYQSIDAELHPDVGKTGAEQRGLLLVR